MSVFFIDLDNNVESIGKKIVDAMPPYERITIIENEPFTVTENHMVRLCTP